MATEKRNTLRPWRRKHKKKCVYIQNAKRETSSSVPQCVRVACARCCCCCCCCVDGCESRVGCGCGCGRRRRLFGTIIRRIKCNTTRPCGRTDRCLSLRGRVRVLPGGGRPYYNRPIGIHNIIDTCLYTRCTYYVVRTYLLVMDTIKLFDSR